MEIMRKLRCLFEGFVGEDWAASVKEGTSTRPATQLSQFVTETETVGDRETQAQCRVWITRCNACKSFLEYHRSFARTVKQEGNSGGCLRPRIFVAGLMVELGLDMHAPGP